MEFAVQDDGTALMVPATVHLADLEGILPAPDTPVTVEAGHPQTRRTGGFLIEDADEAWIAWRAYRDRGADFAGCLLARINLARGCDATATFDRNAQRTAGFEPLGISRFVLLHRRSAQRLPIRVHSRQDRQG